MRGWVWKREGRPNTTRPLRSFMAGVVGNEVLDEKGASMLFLCPPETPLQTNPSMFTSVLLLTLNFSIITQLSLHRQHVVPSLPSSACQWIRTYAHLHHYDTNDIDLGILRPAVVVLCSRSRCVHLWLHHMLTVQRW